MSKIQLCVKIGETELWRNFEVDDPFEKSSEEWGEEVTDLLDTLTKSYDN